MDTANAPTPDYAHPGEPNDAVETVVTPVAQVTKRITVRGKFLFAGEEKFWIKGVTYGTFRPREDGTQFPDRETVARDFALMAAQGINSVRTYTPPPRWLLDTAQEHGLRVMAGLAWEQHVTFLDDRELVTTIEGRIREGIRACAGHPSLLCYSVGNEIPPSIVRWHGRHRIERFIKRLYQIAKNEDPDGLVTYVSYPTTEYLQLPFLDLYCFNVYLEDPNTLAAYLARLQNLAGEQPLVMAEIGLDSRRNGEDVQGESLDWQVRTAFAEGCAGAFVFAWTDEWYRGGHDIEDWDFGLTTRDRTPKPALATVNKAFTEVPFPADTVWPAISVVVCSYNGAATIRDTLEGLAGLDYPDYEVIVVNDGSTDDTPRIADEYDVKLISTENRGLSNARNNGWQEATCEIVAYIDDDAYPDPHWLQYLAHTFMTTEYVGVGGPNIAPPGDGPIADCIANAPGGPVHVLLTDTVAEHIPGCNMAFRREALKSIDGFDPRYRAAGDDVDVCWRLQEQGGKIGFHAAAMDWHHRRNSLRMYWRQQQGYGKAEALLEEKWPEKYNALGHFPWSGRLYGKGLTEALPGGHWRIYQGQWGSALFQSLYAPATGFLTALPLMPEWYFVIGLLAALSLLGLAWPPLLWAVPLLILAVVAPVAQAIISAAKAEFPTPRPDRSERLKLRALTATLHLLQPFARLKGRLQHGLTPWRKRGQGDTLRWRAYATSVWREEWQEPAAMLERLMAQLKKGGAVTIHGGDYDSWDLEVRGGLLGAARLHMAVEEHGAGKQLFRFRIWPRYNRAMLLVTLLLAVISLAALSDGSRFVGTLTGIMALVPAARGLLEGAHGMAAMTDAVRYLERS
jgi:GT2 family glycosyltransferase